MVRNPPGKLFLFYRRKRLCTRALTLDEHQPNQVGTRQVPVDIGQATCHSPSHMARVCAALLAAWALLFSGVAAPVCAQARCHEQTPLVARKHHCHPQMHWRAWCCCGTEVPRDQRGATLPERHSGKVSVSAPPIRVAFESPGIAAALAPAISASTFHTPIQQRVRLLL